MHRRTTWLRRVFIRRLTAREWTFASAALLAVVLGGGVAWAATGPGRVTCEPATVQQDGSFVQRCKVTLPTGPTPSASPTATGTPSPSPSTSPTPAPTTPAPTTPAPTTPAPTTPAPTTPAPSPSSSGPRPCMPDPAACGYPTAATTGVPAGRQLQVVDGDLVVDVNGTVIEGKEIRGCVTVNAADVVIRESRIVADGCFWGVRNTGSNLALLDVELTCGGGNGTGVGSSNLYLARVDIHGCENGLDVAGHVTVRDSYIHDGTTANGAHTDGVQIGQGAEFVLLDHNTIIVPAPGGTSAIIMWDEGDPQNRDVLISGNLLAGGTWTLYCPRQNSTNVRIINNRFGPYQYGSANSCIPGHVAEFSGNVDDFTGSPLIG